MNIGIGGKDLMKIQYNSDADYEHIKKVREAFEIKTLGEYHDLYVQCDIFLLADVFKTLEISVFKYMKLILLIFCLQQD